VHCLLFAARADLNIKSLWFRSHFNWQRDCRQLLFYTNSSFLFSCSAKNTVVPDPYKAYILPALVQEWKSSERTEAQKGNRLMESSFISTRSKQRVMQKFKSLAIHKCRKSIEEIASKLRPVIQGVINDYCKFWSSHASTLWNKLNLRLLKWVKWEKGLYMKAAFNWLKTKNKEKPGLFLHWKLVHP
jgi:hypothetical protein